METVRFVCEFFFDDFWHWLGLFVILCVVCRSGIFSFNRITEINHNKNERKET